MNGFPGGRYHSCQDRVKKEEGKEEEKEEERTKLIMLYYD